MVSFTTTEGNILFVVGLNKKIIKENMNENEKKRLIRKWIHDKFCEAEGIGIEERSKDRKTQKDTMNVIKKQIEKQS
jgi:hypothetical protein